MNIYRHHSVILQEAGGAAIVRRRLVERAAFIGDCRLAKISAPAVQSWITRNSVPSNYWADMVALDLTTYEELALAAKASSSTSHADGEVSTQIATQKLETSEAVGQ